MHRNRSKPSGLAAIRADWRARFENRFRNADGRKIEIRAAAADPDTTEMLLYDEIGYWGVTAKDFASALAGVKTSKIHLRVNSPGGDVFDGLAMYNSLKAFKGDVTATVDGLAASAASFVAMAGQKVFMGKGSFMMIHNAWGMAIGNKADMTDMANTLDKIDGQIAAIYAEKCGKPVVELSNLMDGESDGTWLTADEAKALGLVDSIADPEEDDDLNETGEDDPDHEIEQRGGLSASGRHMPERATSKSPRAKTPLRFAMAVELNAGGERHAEALIESGDYDLDSDWSFSAKDGNKLLDDGQVGPRYRNHFLGRNTDEPEDAKAGWEYPFAKDGTLYRSALTAIRSRAAQNDANAVFEAAGRLLEKLDEKSGADKEPDNDPDDDLNETGEEDPNRQIEQRRRARALRRLRLAEAA